MPTYTIHANAEMFTGGQREELARAITAVHSEHTGAPKSFVQVIFLPVLPRLHFVGGELADPRSVWVYGHIRSGRPAGVRTSIAEGIATALETTTQVPRQFLWIYLSELAHTDMIEFGSVLPVPGAEAAWVQDMDPAIRDRLNALG